MSAGTYNIEAEEFGNLSISLVYQDADGTAINLTNYTAVMDVLDQSSGLVVLTLSSANGRIILGNTAGTIVLSLDPVDIPAAGVYLYDLMVVDGSGFKTPLIRGFFTIDVGVTQ